MEKITSDQKPLSVEPFGISILGYQAKRVNFNVKEVTITSEENPQGKREYTYERVELRPMEWSYDSLVPKLIRAHYSADDEFAVQRKAILGDKKEFEEYNDWVQYCKSFAKSLFNEK